MGGSNEALKDYASKRELRATPEPADGDIDFEWAKERPIFVIQEHEATSRHFDFRLEAEGVLKSWAVPKGPSTDPREKRLAIRTEDHPLAYADFEGVIPEGEYGGGTVLVWDRGSFSNLQESENENDGKRIVDQIQDGKVTVSLSGEKITGGYALVRTDSGEDERWLLIKMDDDEADARRNPTSTEPKSVKSGRTLDEIRQDAENEGG